ncbi:SDH family Clp fold serine proteinase [Lacrimispora sp.]|uniref:SDH family Clp fold serine proteinase n=1 Tax=Lacrimispora sp. TaxID=2719234 RepID=UPI003994C69E
MAGWNDILNEIKETPPQFDYVRRSYLKKLSDYTGRNTICYYSGWLSKRGANNVDINDSDMAGFMNSIQGMDCSKGLDLILHTPGGDPAASEAIVNYIRIKFNSDVRAIIPQLAMSAGTMIACSAKEIIMGKQSSLGPIDPQFNGIPAYNIKSEFEEAKEDLLKDPKNAQYWMIKLQQYPAAFMKTALDAIELSGKLVEEWLGSCMFDKNDPKDIVTIRRIVNSLNEHDNSKNHGRHLNIKFCKEIGLKIHELESDAQLQDLVLSVHHAYMITLDGSTALKIIENQNGKILIANQAK